MTFGVEACFHSQLFGFLWKETPDDIHANLGNAITLAITNAANVTDQL